MENASQNQHEKRWSNAFVFVGRQYVVSVTLRPTAWHQVSSQREKTGTEVTNVKASRSKTCRFTNGKKGAMQLFKTIVCISLPPRFWSTTIRASDDSIKFWRKQSSKWKHIFSLTVRKNRSIGSAQLSNWLLLENVPMRHSNVRVTYLRRQETENRT